MSNLTKFVAVIMIAGTSLSMADISLSFTNSLSAYTYTGSQGTITMDFTVGGGGAVTMDASTSATDAGFIAAVNGWDGAVGTADSAFAGQTFQLTFGNIHLVDRTTGLPNGLYERICLRNTGGGIMGSGGGNSGRIDWTSGAQEVFHIEQTGGSGVTIGLIDFSWHANSTAIPNACDLTLMAGSVNNTFYDMAGASNGTVSVSSYAYVIGRGTNDLTIREPLDGNYGAGLTAMTLQITAVPEPATTGLLGLGAISILLIRRFKSHA